jgi:hypothetical protein
VIYLATFKGGKPLGMTLNTGTGHCLVAQVDRGSQAEELDVRVKDFVLYVEVASPPPPPPYGAGSCLGRPLGLGRDS